MSKSEVCSNCRSPKVAASCGHCDAGLCKSCKKSFNWEVAFPLLSEVDSSLQHFTYCDFCFAEVVEPAIESYQIQENAAKEVLFWPKNYRGQIPVLEKSTNELSVSGAKDRADALIRLAFLVSKAGFNGLTRTLVKYEKHRDHGYQTMRWSASGFPVNVDRAKIERLEELNWD